MDRVGRSVNGPFQESLTSFPYRGRSSFVPCWWLWLTSWGLLEGHRMFLTQPRKAEGHSPPLYLCILGGCFLSVTSHLPCPQARLLGTLAVSRGLGDHQLRVLDTNIQLKPFLLSVPQVRGQQPTPASICPGRQRVRPVGAGKGTLRDPQA